MSEFWNENPHLIEQLKAHVESGLSSSQTARAMSRDNKLIVTRNMVLGKAKRLGIPFKHPSPKKDKPTPRPFLLPRSGAARTKGAPKPPKALPEDDGELLPLSDENGKPFTVENSRSDHCRFPYGEVGADFRYCGRQAVKRRFCEAHAKIVFTKSYMDAPTEEAA